MPSGNTASANQAAAFVSGLAWTFIGLSALSAVLSAVLYVLSAHLLPMEPRRAAVAEAIHLKLLPPWSMTVLEQSTNLLIVCVAASLLTLLVSIALLKRKNWARVAFAWIMVATALLHLAGLVLPFYLMHDFFADMPPELRGIATRVATVLSVVSGVMGLVFAGFFAWAAKRLFAGDIKREFLPPRNPG